MTEIVLDVARSTPQQVVSAIVLAMRHSQMGTLVSEDKLVNLLADKWSTLSPREGVLSIKGMMEVLKGLPGYEFQKAVPSLCRIKTWEPYLKMHVEIPTEFVMKRIVNHAEHAATCRVPDTELAKVLPSAATALSVFSGKVRPISMRNPVVVEPPPRRGRMIALVVLGVLLGLGTAGGAAFVFLSREVPAVPVDVTVVSDEIPLLSASRRQDTVTATLRDRAWLSFPRAERTEQVDRALRRVSRIPGVLVLRLEDRMGKTIATARFRVPDPIIEMVE